MSVGDALIATESVVVSLRQVLVVMVWGNAAVTMVVPPGLRNAGMNHPARVSAPARMCG